MLSKFLYPIFKILSAFASNIIVIKNNGIINQPYPSNLSFIDTYSPQYEYAFGHHGERALHHATEKDINNKQILNTIKSIINKDLNKTIFINLHFSSILIFLTKIIHHNNKRKNIYNQEKDIYSSMSVFTDEYSINGIKTNILNKNITTRNTGAQIRNFTTFTNINLFNNIY